MLIFSPIIMFPRDAFDMYLHYFMHCAAILADRIIALTSRGTGLPIKEADECILSHSI